MDEMHYSGRYASETMSQFIVAQLLSLIASAWEWNVIQSSLSGPQEICVVSQISKSMLRVSKVSHILQFVFDSLYLKRSIRQGLVCVVCNWKAAEKNHTHLSLEAIIEHFQIRPVFFLGLFHFCGMTKQILNYYTGNISWKQTWKKMQLNWLFYSYGDFYSLLHSSSCTGYIDLFFFLFFLWAGMKFFL